MKSVSIGELRQNPTKALAEVEGGATYRITRHNREVGRLVPPGSDVVMLQPKKRDGSRTARLEKIELKTAATIDELIEDAKGHW
ncbi:MAG TPA: type II toxin-antitoxin system Phd/YefM family antitoxin [Candidatus Agrococcus pullicola]|uniref:Antitoxin n=1 Tax=Candidatus Agrococcus pullicola TaxID=2838429 RepID=A0A9D2C9W9_9MICO|nr:type II toxin-antitoxin system Phd/YefM family antitoxin [Candidatus Agrococcus pullicola]